MDYFNSDTEIGGVAPLVELDFEQYEDGNLRIFDKRTGTELGFMTEASVRQSLDGMQHLTVTVQIVRQPWYNSNKRREK